MTYRLVDGLGSTVNLCDEDGNLVGEYTYDAYGNVRSQTGAETEFSFAGEQSDPNGLDYLRARYYDPEVGRFLGRDPAGEGSNFYAYALNNPVNGLDPSGLWTICRAWDSTLSDPSTGSYTCSLTQEVDVVYTSQVVYDADTNGWVVPFGVQDWEDDDWACVQGACVGGDKHLLAVGVTSLNPGSYQALIACDAIWQEQLGSHTDLHTFGCGLFDLSGGLDFPELADVLTVAATSAVAAKGCYEGLRLLNAMTPTAIPQVEAARQALPPIGAGVCAIAAGFGIPTPSVPR